MNQFYLSKSMTAINLDKLIKADDSRQFSERMSSRMVKCASVLPVGEHIGWQMIVPRKGKINMTLFGSESLSKDDLEWIAENSAKTTKVKKTNNDISGFNKLYELYLPVADNASATVGFTAVTAACNDGLSKWPTVYSSQFGELVTALKQNGAIFRVAIGSSTEEEQEICRRDTLRTFDTNRIDVVSYIGKPVRTRVLLRVPQAPSVRLKSILEESVSGMKLTYLGNMEDESILHDWNDPLAESRILPDYAARIMIMEPILSKPIVGIEVCEEEVKLIPATHKSVKSKGSVTIGKATDVTGVKRKITIGDTDLRRHFQVIGQTGCGKSTLLTSVILSAIEQGHGLTFFDPHGTTIDTVLRCVPGKYAHKIRVVRIGDAENPVPLNFWDSGDPLKEERNISDLCELFSDIFDPKREGFVGPRYERWLSTFSKLSLAVLGKRASLESIAVISQNQQNMKRAAEIIRMDYPELYDTVRSEYLQDTSNDFTAVLNWYLCKFQAITSVEQLRKTMGASGNALDFLHTIDTDTVNLIDLASPTIGAHAARIVGTLTLMKLWNAAITRKERDKTHLVVLDEAALFKTTLPRILAEGRKFGVACILCHQHASQLTSEIRDALEANSANFCAFRLSPKDAYTAALRFDDPEMKVTLTRLNAFKAVTTISNAGIQSEPFTLETVRPKQQRDGEKIALQIEQNSIETLVKPYQRYRALTPAEINEILKGGKKPIDDVPDSEIIADENSDNKEASEFLSDWIAYKDKQRKVS